MVPVLLAASAAAMNGTADFLGGKATRRVQPAVAVAWSQFLGLAVTVVVACFWHGEIGAQGIIVGAATGLALAGALAVLYRGLGRHAMTVVSPVAAVASALVPITWAMLRHEWPSAVTGVGIGLAVVSIVAASGMIRPTSAHPRRGPNLGAIGHGVGAGLCFGVVLVLLTSVRASDGLWPIVAARAMAVVVLAGVAVALGQRTRVSRRDLPGLALCGVLGVAGHTAVVVAAATGPALIVGALASMYPAATVSLARAVHRERLSRWQVVGLGSALAALALMVLGSA